jgi:hypothetical protein
MAGKDVQDDELLARSLLELSVVQRAADEVTSAFDLDELLGRCIDLMRELAHTNSG